MAYEENIKKLHNTVESQILIQDISENGTVSIKVYNERTKKIWNEALEPFEKIKLWEGATPGYDSRDLLQPEPYLVFIPAGGESQGKDTILIAHGGGFESRTGAEGINVADYFHKAGYNTAVLCYRLEPYSRFDAIADMQRAIRQLRNRSRELGIGEKIAVMGFSAGGMLSGNCSTHFDYGNPDSVDEVERFACRPDAAVIGYGAMSGVSFPLPFGMVERDYKMGKTREERLYLATEKNIKSDTPPMFIWQTLSDDGRHGMCLAKALQDAEIPYELHIFQPGVHGLAMADGENGPRMDIPHVARWGELCMEWFDEIGFRCKGDC